jgi:hypothetical protein
MVNGHRYFSAALLVAGLLTTAPACATQTYRYPSTRNGGYYGRDVDRIAYDNGYRDGQRAGERDARSGRSYSYNRHDDWRSADDGYRREFGNFDYYRRTYRNAFERAYSDSFNRYAGYGRSQPSYPTYPTYPTYPGYPSRGGVAVPRGTYSPAGQNGYRDGLEAGRNDVRSRKAYDPVRAKRYREGDHDYDNRYGSRDEYKREYRAAFEQGYRDGYGRY